MYKKTISDITQISTNMIEIVNRWETSSFADDNCISIKSWLFIWFEKNHSEYIDRFVN